MTSFFAAYFIKNYENIKNPEIRRKYGILNGFIGIILNLFLFAIKLFAGFISNSISIMADAFNNLSDAASSIVTIIGFYLAGKPAEAEHPFGHGRLEYVSGLVVSFLILLMAYQLLVSSIKKVLHPEIISLDYTIVVIMLLSVVVKIFWYVNNRKLSKTLNSSAIGAIATDSLSDAFATTIVLIAAGISFYSGIYLDGWCGVLVAVMVGKAGLEAAKDTISPLLGNPPSAELVRDVEHTVLSYKEIYGIHDLVIHDYGPGRFMMSLHVEVSDKSDIIKIHDLIDRIEKELEEKFQCEAVIHMDPTVTDDIYTKKLREKIEKVVKHTGIEFTIHDFRVVRGDTHTNVIFDLVIPFDYYLSDKEVERKIKQNVKQFDDKLVAVVHVEKPFICKEES